MANYKKSFNFRSGVQVDNDRFIVDGRGNVGVGTSTPNREFDVFGTARINGLLDTSRLTVSGVSTFSSTIGVGASIFFNPSSGVITAFSYRGDGRLLDGVIAIATDGWVKRAGTLSTTFNVYVGPSLDSVSSQFQVGVGATSFTITPHPDGFVGIGTTIPTEKLVVNGNVNVSGIITASQYTVGQTKLTNGNLNLSGNIYWGNVWLSGRDINFAGEWDGGSNYGDYIFTQRSSFGGLTEVARIRGLNGNLILGNQAIANSGNLIAYGNASISGITTVVSELDVGLGGTIFAVLPSGRIGIGSTTPITTFDVKGNTSIQNLNVTGITTISVSSTSTALRISQLGAGDAFIVEDETNPDSTPFIVKGDGSVGVGTTNPLSKLHVNGTLTVSGGGISASGQTITATTFSGNLSGTASNATTLDNAANIASGTISDARLPDVITSNLLAVSGVTTITKLKALSSVGIGTEQFTADFQIRKQLNSLLEVISDEGTATIGIGSQPNAGNFSAQLSYNPVSQVLNLDNRGSGEVIFHVHKGNGAVVGTQTGGFFFKTGSSGKTLLNLSHDGRVSVNEDVPVLTDKGFSLLVNGNAKIRGNVETDYGLNILGIATIQNLNVIGIATFPVTQNFNTTTGLTTFNNLNILSSGRLTVSGLTTFLGITSFSGGVVYSGSIPTTSYNPINLYGTTLGLSTSKIRYDNIGGDISGFTDPRNATLLALYQNTIPNNGILPYAVDGDVQIRTGGLNIISQDYIAVHPSLASSETGNWPGLTPAQNVGMGLRFINNNLCKVGFNTLYIRSIFDVGYGNTANSSYFIPPRLSTDDIYYVSQLWNPNVAGPSAGNWSGHARANLATPDGLTSGGIVYDVTASQLKVAVAATTFCGVATYTNNHSGFGAFVPPSMTTTQRNTMTNAGIQSGAIIYNQTSNRLEVRLNNTWFGIATVV